MELCRTGSLHSPRILESVSPLKFIVPYLIEKSQKFLGWSGIRVAGFSLQHGYHSNPTTPKLQHPTNQEQYDQCDNSTE